MTPEQEHMWNILGNRYQHLAHRFAREILAVKTEDAMMRRANKFFKIVIDTFPRDDIIKTVHLWLNKYQLPLVPSKIPEFDRFHDTYGQFITDNVESFIKQKKWYD